MKLGRYINIDSCHDRVGPYTRIRLHEKDGRVIDSTVVTGSGRKHVVGSGKNALTLTSQKMAILAGVQRMIEVEQNTNDGNNGFFPQEDREPESIPLPSASYSQQFAARQERNAA